MSTLDHEVIKKLIELNKECKFQIERMISAGYKYGYQDPRNPTTSNPHHWQRVWNAYNEIESGSLRKQQLKLERKHITQTPHK